MIDEAHRETLALMETLVLLRHQRFYRVLRRFGKRQSMLHPDVLQLIHYFARTSCGAILEIGPFRGGSTVAAALGLRESGATRKFVTVEQGGRLRHHKLATRNIIRTLKRNLARKGVADLVTVIEGHTSDATIVAAVHQALGKEEIGLLILDADVGIKRDFKRFGAKLRDRAWVLIDDYIGPADYDKVGSIKEQVDNFVGAGQLIPLGHYGYTSWVGKWVRSLPGAA